MQTIRARTTPTTQIIEKIVNDFAGILFNSANERKVNAVRDKIKMSYIVTIVCFMLAPSSVKNSLPANEWAVSKIASNTALRTSTWTQQDKQENFSLLFFEA